jgi:hypothetical protein
MAYADRRLSLLFVSLAHQSGVIQFVCIPAGWIGESITVLRKLLAGQVAASLLLISPSLGRLLRLGENWRA